MLLQQTDEIAVFSEHDGTCGASCRKNIIVLRVAKTNLPQRLRRERKIGRDPAGNPW